MNSSKQYFLCEEHFDLKPGDTLYEYRNYDFGITDYDSLVSGVRHLAITKERNGREFYSVPETSLIEILELEEITEEEYIAQSTQH